MAASWRRGEMAQAFWRCMAAAINGVTKAGVSAWRSKALLQPAPSSMAASKYESEMAAKQNR
jgi:hypothetical protein